MGRLENYRTFRGPQRIPETMRAVVLDGAGFDRLSLREIPVPRPGPEQILGRIDAAGICTSLIKLVEQGPKHAFVYGWDIGKYPLILGDEGSVTIIEVGERLRDRYRAGERYVVQPAVDCAPINHLDRYRDGGVGIGKVAAGYTLPGHLSEFMLVPEEVIRSGCLLPCPEISYAAAAMGEPISCVISSQDHHTHLVQADPIKPRSAVKGLKPGGVTVVIGAGVMGRLHVELALSYRPRAIVAVDLIPSRLERVHRLFAGRARERRIELVTINAQDTDPREAIARVTNHRGADDVIVAVGSRPVIEAAGEYAGRGAVLNLFGGLKKGEDIVRLDTGIVHYREIQVTGSSGGSPYDIARTLELVSQGEIDPAHHIARVGGLEAAIDFLKEVKAQTIDGKAIVYPSLGPVEPRSVDSWSARDEDALLEAELREA